MPDCPTCDDTFDTERGKKVHHARAHGESLVDNTPENGHGCPTCERNDFKSETGVKIHHAQVHGESLAKTTVNCDNCSGPVEKYESEMEGHTYHYCSPDCREEHQAELPPEEQPAWRGGKATVECHICGTEKEVKPYRVEQTEKFFCGPECLSDWRSSNNIPQDIESRDYTGQNNPNWNSVEIECDWCGDTRYKNKSRVERSEQDFCSHDCHNKWMAKNQVGPNHHQWGGGRPDYGPGWTPEKRREVRQRSDFKCEDCGMSQKDLLEQSNRKLHVHHITPAKQIDDPQERNSVENLIALCIQCHPKWEKLPGLRPDTREQPAD